MMPRVGWVASVAMVASLVALAPASSVGDVAPPWVVSDSHALGTVSLFDSSGAQVFDGYDITNIASYLAASTTGTGSQVTFKVAVPDPTSAPAEWCSQAIESNVAFDHMSPGLPGVGTEFATATAGGAPFLAANPLLTPAVEPADPPNCPLYSYSGSGTNYTSTYANRLELRLSDSSDGTYWRTVIEYNPTSSLGVVDGLDGGSWRQVYPAPALTVTQLAAPDAVPATNPLPEGASVTLSVTLTAENSAHPDGVVEFFDDLDPFFYSPYSTWNAATGVATLGVSPTSGDHRFYARFTPYSSNYLASTSPRRSLRVKYPAPQLSGAAPSITGSGLVGTTLTCSSGQWDQPLPPAVGYTYSYVWNYTLNGLTSTLLTVPAGPGTTSTTARLAQRLYGAAIVCQVTASNSDGVTATRTTRAVAVYGGSSPEEPANLVPPVITGRPRVGSILRCLAGTWSQGGLTYTYVWKRGNTVIRSVTTTSGSANSGTLASSLRGRTLTCAVTGVNRDNLSVTATSVPSHVIYVGPLPPAPVVKPRISGLARVGGTVRCSSGTWNQTGLTYAYAWRAVLPTKVLTIGFRPSAQLSIATAGARLQCSVRATNRFGLSRTLTVVGAVVARALAPRIVAPASKNRPRILGTAAIGRTVGPQSGTWVFTPSVKSNVVFSYTWLRFSRISRGLPVGTSVVVGRRASYQVSATDRGAYLVLKVQASHSGYITGVANSLPVLVK